MILNRVKLRLAVTLMKYLSSAVSLNSLPKALIQKKMALNLLKFAELVVNELKKTMSKNICQYSSLYPIIYY